MSTFSTKNLKTLREQYPNIDKETLKSHLISKQDDVEQANKSVAKYVSWKLANYPILKSSIINELNTGKLYVRGVDREGNPLLIFCSRYNFPKERDLEQSVKMCAWMVQHALNRPPGKKYTLLLDRTNHSTQNTDLEFMKRNRETNSVSFFSIGRFNFFFTDYFFSHW